MKDIGFDRLRPRVLYICELVSERERECTLVRYRQRGTCTYGRERETARMCVPKIVREKD